MNIKKIELEMYFDDDFCPPEKFDEPNRSNDWKSNCSLCPFYGFGEETGFGWCNITSKRDPEEECPINKFFE
jgi:hypothetical protein